MRLELAFSRLINHSRNKNAPAEEVAGLVEFAVRKIAKDIKQGDRLVDMLQKNLLRDALKEQIKVLDATKTKVSAVKRGKPAAKKAAAKKRASGRGTRKTVTARARPKSNAARTSAAA